MFHEYRLFLELCLSLADNNLIPTDFGVFQPVTVSSIISVRFLKRNQQFNAVKIGQAARTVSIYFVTTRIFQARSF